MLDDSNSSIEKVIEDFYKINSPSEHLETMNDLLEAFLSAAKDLEFTDTHIQNITFRAHNIGLFLVKLKEEVNNTN